jgi:hypothetical protein
MTPAVSGEKGSADEEPATRFNAATFAFEKTAPKSKKAASKAKRGKASKMKATGSHQNYDFGKRITDDDEFTAEMARYLREDPKLSWSGVLKLMRRDGIGGGTKLRLVSSARHRRRRLPRRQRSRRRRGPLRPPSPFRRHWGRG